MKILTALNVLPDIESLSEAEFKVSDSTQLDTFFLTKVFDIYNESALEIALRSKDMSNTIIDTVSKCSSDYEYLLKDLYSYGINKVFRIPCEENKDIDIATTLNSFVKSQGDYDIYLFGKKGLSTSSGITPLRFATISNLPVINNVISISEIDGSFDVVSNNLEGELTQRIASPFVAIVGDAPNTMLRVPTLKQKLAGKKKTVNLVEMDLPFNDIKSIAISCSQQNNSREGKKFEFTNSDECLNFISSFVMKYKNVKVSKQKTKSQLPLSDSDIFIANSNDINNEIAVRFATEQDLPVFLDVESLERHGNNITVVRKEYAGNLLCRYSIDNCGVFTVNNVEAKNKFDFDYKIPKANVIKENLKASESNDNIENADVIFVVGGGIAKETLIKIEMLAAKCNALICGSRQAAMLGLVPLSFMLGVSGKQVSPNVLVTFGVSGAEAFFAGVSNSGKILAIDSNENAPIFRKSDVYINATAEAVLESLDERNIL